MDKIILKIVHCISWKYFSVTLILLFENVLLLQENILRLVNDSETPTAAALGRGINCPLRDGDNEDNQCLTIATLLLLVGIWVSCNVMPQNN